MSGGFLEARDLIGALRFLERRGFPAQRVGVLALSIGAATAMFALEKVTYGGLVVDSPLAGLSQDFIARNVASALGLPAPLTKIGAGVFTFGAFTAAHFLWGMSLGAEAVDVLRRQPIPTVVIHGKADKVVPASVGQEVAQAAGDALVGTHFLEGVEHAGAYEADPPWYIDTVCEAFEKMLK